MPAYIICAIAFKKDGSVRPRSWIEIAKDEANAIFQARSVFEKQTAPRSEGWINHDVTAGLILQELAINIFKETVGDQKSL